MIQSWLFNCAAPACTVTSHIASSSLMAMLDPGLMSFDFQGKAFPNAVLFPVNGFLGSAVVKSSHFKGESFTSRKAGRRFCCMVCWESLQRCLKRQASAMQMQTQMRMRSLRVHVITPGTARSSQKSFDHLNKI